MADIEQALARIMHARYGEEVRGSIYDAINELYITETGVKPGNIFIFNGSGKTTTLSALRSFGTYDIYRDNSANITDIPDVHKKYNNVLINLKSFSGGQYTTQILISSNTVPDISMRTLNAEGSVYVNWTTFGKQGNNWDPLRGRKWAVCGDSFTAGNFSGSSTPVIESGSYKGHVATYPWLIASRADMKIQDLAAGGRTLATPADGSFSNCFSDRIYQTIAEDADIVTLYFGINDSHHRPGASGSDGEDVSGTIKLGTINDADTTTFYGAWNVVVSWILENRPGAHLGIIVSNGCETDDYRLATIAIARKWGVPYLDLNGDERTPMMLRSTNPDISSKAKDIALKKWRVGESNQHPNALAHAFESTVIEHFLRTL